MVSGIYAIVNKINGKMYIGSSIDIHTRFIRHRCNLNAGRHDSIHLLNAWKKYGEENFEFKILERCTSTLEKREQFYINKYRKLVYNTNPNVYPVARGEQSGTAKLKETDVRKIVNLRKSGKTIKEILEKYPNISYGTVRGICLKISWMHVKREKVDRNDHNLTPNQVSSIKAGLVNNKTIKSLSEKLKIPYSIIYRIKRFETYVDVSSHLNEKIRAMAKPKMSSAIAEEMKREFVETNITLSELYSKYELYDKNVIRHALIGKTWKYSRPDLTNKSKEKIVSGKRKVSDSNAKFILRSLKNKTYSRKELMKMFGLGKTTINDIRTGNKRWKNL